MKKCLLFATLLIVLQLNKLSAQGLFNAPDTVCVHQDVHITSNVSNPITSFWGFCSGFLMETPTGTNIGDTFSFHNPTGIDVVKDKNGDYYGFVLNADSNQLIRLFYGKSLDSIPTVTRLGDLAHAMPTHPNNLYILQDSYSGYWFIFISGGTNQANSTIARVDFAGSLSSTPEIVNFGNLFGQLDVPTGIFVAPEGNQWYGYVTNKATSSLVKLFFSNNVSNTPLPFNQGNFAGVSGGPTDMAAIKDQLGNWYLFVTNQINSSVSRFDIGTTLSNNSITGINVGNLNGRIQGPTAISLTRDCNQYYGFITNGATNELIRMDMGPVTGPYVGVDYLNVGNMNHPAGLSSIIRDHENVYAFVTNSADSSLTKIKFAQCANSTIATSTDSIPPVYSYDTPGVFNIYYTVDEGLPTMQVDCKLITVLAYPPFTITQDTLICERDTITLGIVSNTAIGYLWSPDHNISDTNTAFVQVYPDFDTTYFVTIRYPHGCTVDTSVRITISRVTADAGPDRIISDGATTILGGPNTSMRSTGSFSYSWFPEQYISDTSVTNPTANPPYNFTYYLKVTEYNDKFQCTDIDTVVVDVSCGNLYLPNAFVPGSENAGSSRFGILNKEIAKLNYLRVYDRWGQLMFETSDATQKWDGTVNGKDAPFGVYVWEADGFCLSGKKFTKTGNVTLIR